MQKIVPHLWFDKEAKEAAEFYVSAFGADSKIIESNTLHNTPSGDADMLTFQLLGQEFMAISAGPLFKFNASISFFVNFDPSRDPAAKENLQSLWDKLSEGGTAMMELAEYPFSKYYGWIQDKYGVSWQLILTDPDGDEQPNIVPSVMFVGELVGKAEEATDFYLSVFKDSKRGILAHYPAGMEPDKEGTVMFTDFQIAGEWLAACDSAQQHDFTFNEAISLVIRCEDQAEIDYYWEKLSAIPEADLPAPRPSIFFVYAILCGNSSIYIGQTQNLKKRWQDHEAGLVQHTKKYKPLQVIHYEEFNSRQEAVEREKDLKTGFGRKWLKREWKAGRTRQAGQCGWLKDKYGVSWQVVPTVMDEMLREGTQEQIGRVTKAFLQMKKFDIAALEKAYTG